MRISGITGMYGFTNTAALRRYNSIRSAAGANRSTNAGRVGERRYGGYSYRARAAAKADAVYESTKTSAQNMRTHAHKLMGTERDSLMSQAEKTGDTKELVKEVKSFVDEYNTMVKNMEQLGGAINNLYEAQLKTNYSSHKEALEAVGITAAKDGSLNINGDVLSQADAAALKKAFGGSESFAGGASVKSIYVEANAVSQQMSAQYANYGGYNSYGGYSSYNPYSSYSAYGNYSSPGSSLGYGGYGSGYSNMIGSLFNSLF